MNERTPKVSVGLPVYNGENYVEDAIVSILNQSFTDFELIISDNASTDKTQAICKRYLKQDNRIKYYRQPENTGHQKNFNFVFQVSCGEYYKWQAHDDAAKPEFLEKCVSELDANPEVVVAYPRSILINESGKAFGTYADNLDIHNETAHERFKHYFNNQGLCHALFGLMRTSALKRTLLLGNYAMADRVLLGSLVLLGEFTEIPDYLFVRRIHPLISTKAHSTNRSLAAWFDPKYNGKPVYPKWKRLSEYFRVVERAELAIGDEIMCYLQIVKFALYPEKWRGLFRELVKPT